MIDKSFTTEQLVTRGIFTETTAADVRIRTGEPKPLRPQAIRLRNKLAMETLRRRFRGALAMMTATFVLWVAIPLLPMEYGALDMKAIRTCLYTVAMLTTLAGLYLAFAMTRCRADDRAEI